MDHKAAGSYCLLLVQVTVVNIPFTNSYLPFTKRFRGPVTDPSTLATSLKKPPLDIHDSSFLKSIQYEK
ncbi:MAG TPA: hypothetical protein PLD84_09725 [Chitinophagales bacterium]|nr:hypothetical protein [Chitinophagales bacterium]